MKFKIRLSYLSTVVLGGGLIAAGGSEAQRETLLPALAEGNLMLAVAFAEPQSRYALDDVATTAARGATVCFWVSE